MLDPGQVTILARSDLPHVTVVVQKVRRPTDAVLPGVVHWMVTVADGAVPLHDFSIHSPSDYRPTKPSDQEQIRRCAP
jgi:hypothetical protein